MNDLITKVKLEMIDKLSSSCRADEPYLIACQKTYTRRELAFEIENETEFGIETLTSLLTLALDLIARQKV